MGYGNEPLSVYLTVNGFVADQFAGLDVCVNAKLGTELPFKTTFGIVLSPLLERVPQLNCASEAQLSRELAPRQTTKVQSMELVG